MEALRWGVDEKTEQFVEINNRERTPEGNATNMDGPVVSKSDRL